jgi:restriction endonuclease S subunit
VKSYTYFAENDLLIVKITPCFENGKMELIRKLEQGFGFGSTEYYVLRSSNRILPEYLFFVLNNPILIEEGSNNMSGTAGQQRVTRSYINNFKIALPDLKTQQAIVNELKKILLQ